MARPRDNADLLSGGKKIEIETGIDSGLTVVGEEGRTILDIKENGLIYQDHADEHVSDNSGVILVSDGGGIRVTDVGNLEITEDGGETWYPCCSIDPEEEVEEECLNGIPLTFDEAHDASKLISAAGGDDRTGENISAFISIQKKLYTCGATRESSKVAGFPKKNYNEVAVSIGDYINASQSAFKDKFSEIDLTGALSVDYEAEMVRCVGGYYGSSYSAMTMMLLSNGQLWSIGYCNNGNRGVDYDGNYIGDGSSQVWQRETLGYSWIYFAPGWKYTHAIKSDGTLWQCGNSRYSSKGSRSFSQLSSDTDWKIVNTSQSGLVSYGIKTDGSLWSWGDANTGALGRTGSSYQDNAIGRIGNDNDWIYVSAGGYWRDHHFVALKSDGTLWGWGEQGTNALLYNKSRSSNTSFGSALPYRLSPDGEPYIFQIGYDNDWVFCQAGYSNTYALKNNSELWVTGTNGFFQLGIGGADRDGYGRASSTRRELAADSLQDPSQYVGYLGATSTFSEELLKAKKWKGIAPGMTHVLALDWELVPYGAGNNKTKIVPTGSDFNIFGTSMGFDVKSQDRLTPCVFGETDYGVVPQPEPTEPVPPDPIPQPAPGAFYKCTWAGPAEHPPKESDCYRRAHGLPINRIPPYSSDVLYGHNPKN